MGVLDNLSVTRQPNLEEMEVLNHAVAHELSYQSCCMEIKGWGEELPIAVCHSPAGYYLGCVDDEGPVARDSMEYWPTEEEAQEALEAHSWTQRLNP